MKKVLFFLLLIPALVKSQCYENRLAFNYTVGVPFKSGVELSFFPQDGRIGYDAGFLLFDQQNTYKNNGKTVTQEEPKLDAVGRIIFRINQYGTWRHEVTAFGTTRYAGISYRLYYQFGDVLIGLEPNGTTKGPGINLLVSFDLIN